MLIAIPATLHLREERKIPETFRSCVKVFSGREDGCGVILDASPEEIIVVTAFHVAKGWNGDSRVQFHDGKRAFGQIFGGDEALDICFIGIPAEAGEDLSRYRAAAVGQLPPEPFPVYLYDPSGIRGEQRIDGEVLALKEYLYEFDRKMLFGRASVKEGMSGSAIFTDEGILAGILLAGNGEGILAGACTDDILKCYGGPF
ncbi:MAG: serine protease [Lachnospiraceae bacterium]|nr:serine protease [Lachnospiraceae bacterium]